LAEKLFPASALGCKIKDRCNAAMHPFVHQANPSRIIFGPGTLARLPEELDRLGTRRALILCTAQQLASAERVAALLGERSAGIFAKAVMHVPIESAREARDEARRLGADCAVAIGGGSTTGLGKAIALDSGLPIIAVPTTYAGSEVTPIYGLTEGGVKKTGRDARVLPRTVIYDPELSLTLPLAMTVTSAFNAMAHAAEGLYAHDRNPIASLMAEEGIRASAAALPRLSRDASDMEARSDALYGAWLCGTVLGAVSMGLHHKICHTLGGSFNLSHADVHAVILPQALAYNAAAAPQAMSRIARALSATPGMSAPRAIFELGRLHGAPVALRDIGMPAAGLDQAAQLAVQNAYPNPRPLERDAIREMLQCAFEGAMPA
jgi:maleylacetate reductase